MRAEDGLDMARKEEYLNDAAFAQVGLDLPPDPGPTWPI